MPSSREPRGWEASFGQTRLRNIEIERSGSGEGLPPHVESYGEGVLAHRDLGGLFHYEQYYLFRELMISRKIILKFEQGLFRAGFIAEERAGLYIHK